MSAIILIALCFALVMFPTLRCAASHPISLLHFGVLDRTDEPLYQVYQPHLYASRPDLHAARPQV